MSISVGAASSCAVAASAGAGVVVEEVVEEIELDGTIFEKGDKGKAIGEITLKIKLVKEAVKLDLKKEDAPKVAPKKVSIAKISYKFSQVKAIHAALSAFWKAHAAKNKIDPDQHIPSFSNHIHRWVWDNYPHFQKSGKKDGDTVQYSGPQPLWRSEENIGINCYWKKPKS